MRIKALILVIIIMFALAAEAKAEWLEKHFTNTWQPDASDFVNTSCQPSDLGGIQTIWTQLGHRAGYILYVFCRHDSAPNVMYKFDMSLVNPESLVSTATTLLGNPAVKLGGYYYGNFEGKDGLLYIQKIK